MSFKVKIRDVDGRDSLSNVNDLGVLPYANEGETLRYDADLGVWEATDDIKIMDDEIIITNDLGDNITIASGGICNISGSYVGISGEIDLYSNSHNDRGIEIRDTNAGFATIFIDTANFDNNLSSADDTLQKCLETIDEMSTGGGSELVNVETLTADKTLVATDKSVQYLAPSGATNRNVYLPNTGLIEGLKFTIRNNASGSAGFTLSIYNGVTLIQVLYSQSITTYIYSGSTWLPYDINSYNTTLLGENNVMLGYNAKGYDYGIAIGKSALGYTTGVGIGWEAQGYNQSVAIGYSSQGYDYGIAIGKSAKGYTDGVGVGYNSSGYTKGVAVGRDSIGRSYGVAVGFTANSNLKGYSSALNAYAKCERVNELTLSYTGATTNLSNFCIIGIKQKDYSAALGYEVFLDASSARLVLVNNSTLNFTLYFTAMDTANGDTHYWKVQGLCKNVAGTVTILNQSVVEEYSDAGLSLAALTLTADDTNNALRVNFAALAGKTIRVGGHFRLHDLRY